MKMEMKEMKIDRYKLIDYLFNNMNINNTTINGEDTIIISINELVFKIHFNYITYTKLGISDIIKYTHEELDNLIDKGFNLYTREDLNIDVREQIRRYNINNILTKIQ